MVKVQRYLPQNNIFAPSNSPKLKERHSEKTGIFDVYDHGTYGYIRACYA